MSSKIQPVGSERISKNGYKYTKVAATGSQTWRLTHHIVAEEKILGRPLRDNERVVFVNTKDRLNVHPSNLKIVERGASSTKKRAAQIKVRISELMSELNDLGEVYDG